jgi:hypothetical protein
MIERFNFYDIYGYLLPGAVLLSLGWLPVGIVTGEWPPAEIELALIGGIVSYLLGHLLHIADRYLFTVTEKRELPVEADKTVKDGEVTSPEKPEKGWTDALKRPIAALRGLFAGKESRRKDKPPKQTRSAGKFPHDFLLDEADRTFTRALKGQIYDQIWRRFGLEVTNGGDACDGELGKRRYDAFQLCRRWLIQEKAGSYAEQFEGLYELTRGVAAACLATMFLYFGWALASLSPLLGSVRRDEVAVFVLVVLAGSLSLPFPRWLFWFFGVILWGAGFIAGGRLGIQGCQGVLLACLGFVLAWTGWVFRGEFRRFTRAFAVTVYQDFVVLATTEQRNKPGK